MSNAKDERRFKLIRVDVDLVMTILFNWRFFDQICLPDFGPAVPQGAKAKNVHFDYQSHSLAVLLEHESFDPVQKGCDIPYIAGAEPTKINFAAMNPRSGGVVVTGYLPEYAIPPVLAFKAEATFGTADTLIDAGEFSGKLAFISERTFEVTGVTRENEEASPRPKKGWEFLGAP